MALPFSSVLIPKETESSGPFTPQILSPLISRAIPLTHAPISKSPIVAVGRGSSGRTYIGVNVELPGLPLHHSIHAEQFLIANLTLNDERKLDFLAISTNGRSYFNAPCASCYQFLHETRDASSIQFLITDPTGQNGKYVPLSTFLPQSFSPYNFIPENVPRLLEQGKKWLVLIDNDAARNICAYSDRCNHTKCRALAAASRSYVPYSDCPSGVALMDCRGKVYSGWCMESVVHNSSLGPLQAALVDFVTNGGGFEFDSIVEVVLVEKKFGVSSQAATVKMILEKIALRICSFSVLHCY